MSDNLNFFGAIYNNVAGIKVKDINGIEHTFIEEELLWTSYGQLYVKNMVNPSTAIPQLQGASQLETYSALNATTAVNSAIYNCRDLKSAEFPKLTSVANQYLIRQQGTEYNKLESITIGSIGYPVTYLAGNVRWRYGCHAMELTVTCYVNATSIAEVPTAVSNYIIGDNSFAPSGSIVTVIYRNSTTGEVLA